MLKLVGPYALRLATDHVLGTRQAVRTAEPVPTGGSQPVPTQDPTLTLFSMATTATVVWNLYGFAADFFDRAWAGAPIPVTMLSYLLNAALVISLPFSRSGEKRWILTSTVLGGLMALWSALGVLFLVNDVGLPPGLPTIAGPGVPTLGGILMVIFGIRAYRRLS
jgi:hypothetical protein